MKIDTIEYYWEETGEGNLGYTNGQKKIEKVLRVVITNLPLWVDNSLPPLHPERDEIGRFEKPNTD